MPCQTQNPCTPCNPDYTDYGCLDFPKSECIIYNGDDIPCLNIVKTENLNEVLQHLKDVICALTPTGYGSFDFSCFASQEITTEQQFVEFISGLLCDILGTQTPTTITSLSQLYTLIQDLTTNLNLIKNQTLSVCFQTLSGLSTPQQISQLLSAMQTILCDHETRIDFLEAGGTNTPISVFNLEKDVELTASGLNNHTLTARAILDSDANNALTTSNVGLKVISPSLTVNDTQSINLTASGLHNHTLSADVKISATVGNAASIAVDGLYVNPASITETALIATDSTSINFTQSGVNGHTFTGDVILNPSLTNILQSTPSGLLVSSSLIQDPITPIDTESINLTITGTSGHTLRADAVISPNGGNILQLLANGLYVDSSATTPNAWDLLGNAGTTDNVNFVGTTDLVPLNFRINNIKSGRISTAGEVFLGYQAGLVNTSTAGITAIGYQALKANTSGSENTAVGHGSLSSNIIGIDNSAFGSYSLGANTASFNTAIGHRTLQSAISGTNNTALGAGAGNLVVLTGSYNTFIGAGATTALTTLSKSAAIGYNAIVSANSNIVLGGTGVDKISVAVGATSADNSAVVDITSTSKGFLPPRMTAIQAEAIPSPAEGLLVYATDGTGADIVSKGWWGFEGANWVKLN